MVFGERVGALGRHFCDFGWSLDEVAFQWISGVALLGLRQTRTEETQKCERKLFDAHQTHMVPEGRKENGRETEKRTETVITELNLLGMFCSG